MAVTEDRCKQIDRLVESNYLRGSESLCRLLRYLATQALDNPGTPVREHQIAAEVFGRPATFDPRMDSTVRVQTGRLRTKLTEYYGGPGADDAVVVELPKGAYQLMFHNRSDRVVPESAFAVDVAPQPAAAPPKRDRRWMGRLTLILAPALILVFLLVARFGSHDSTSFSLRRLWGGFAADPATTAVVFPDAPGIADVRIMHRLDGLFAGLGRELRIESAAPSDAAAILVGEDGGILHDFRLQRAPAAVVNLRPQPGEPLNWTDTDTQKYAVVAMELSGNGGRQIMILAGATPADSEAAAEFACGTRGAGDLLERISGSRTGVVRPFEAVLRVSAQAGASAAPQLVAVHGAGG